MNLANPIISPAYSTTYNYIYDRKFILPRDNFDCNARDNVKKGSSYLSTSGSSSTDISDEDEICIIETPRRSGKETQQMRGPKSFSGSIGKRLDNCLDFKVEIFEPIPTKLPDLNTDLLSIDQKYLYQMGSAISAGTVSQNLAIKDPEKLTHSRWLTCANRIFWLYIGTANPTENLKELVNFITKAVERCVKLLTEASISVCGPEARDRFIRTRIKARQDIQIFNTKSQYFDKKKGAETLE
ncbi:hypothetical protein HELRODRAFT_175868 [Helobdella robusta]|uniref:Uncharacterized protein n=1 Tax=Helobdella robusta TaxID=6412 RepID=T1F9S9_HELRO|nr:hypothetical protein HELRODRAFT_175868 [Helobdella robusta]ESO00438.1 hypothetical protein HELRODRAFT_175868 [Helobdella robusta]